MLDAFIEHIKNGLLYVFRLPELVTVFISVLPIVEVRGAIPVATGMGIPPVLGGLYAFIGSSAIVPILLLVLLPFINWLGKTRLFRKAAAVIYEKFEKKSRGLTSGDTAQTAAEQTDEERAAAALAQKKRERKKMWGVFAFVAIPLPLTGVWTGCAVAAIAKLRYPKAVLAVIAGNLVASTIITLLCALLPAAAINYVILAIGILAIAVVVTLIVKIILHKPAPATEGKTDKQNETEE